MKTQGESPLAARCEMGVRRLMTIPRIPIILSVLVPLMVLASPGAGAPGASEGQAVLDLEAPAPTFEPAEDGRGVTPVVAGFGSTSRAGEPALPMRQFLVAIPEGSVPQIRILSDERVVLSGLDLQPVPTIRILDQSEPEWVRQGDRRPGAGRTEGGAGSGDPEPQAARDLRRDRRVYDRDVDFPGEPVRLGQIGYLRDQRFVEVLFYPLAYNPVRHQARFHSKVRVEVRFALPEFTTGGALFRPDPYFEETYRESLANYEQGKAFRVEGTGPLPLSAGGPRYKLLVTQPGIYRLDHAYLTLHAANLLSLDPRTLSIEVDGAEIPISIRSTTGGAGEADGVFGPDDVLEFFGRPKTDEGPTKLNHPFGMGFPDIYQAWDFTDTQVYWLSAGGAAGSHLRVPASSGAPVGGFSLAGDFQENVVWEEDEVFLPTGGDEVYYSNPSLLAGGTEAQRDLSVALPGLAVSGTPAKVTYRIRGGSNPPQAPDHKVRLWVNGDTGNAKEDTWDGDVVRSGNFDVAQSVLTNPSTVHVLALGLPGVTIDRQYLDRITITYRRLFTAVGGALIFSYPNQNARFQVGGLGTAPSIFDISRKVAANGEPDAVLITGAVAGGSNYTFEVPFDPSPSAPQVRTFVVAVPGGYKVPDAVVAAADPVLAVPGQAADFLVIGSAATLDATPGGALDHLLAHRFATQDLTSRVVDIARIYDEFGFGRRDPEAIRRFLNFAYDNWRGPSGTDDPPSFVLLLGDATPDYENNQNLPDWVDQVPTPIMLQANSIIGYYSSDNWLASFRGDDQIPDVFLGRISARSAAQVAGVLDKIRLYESSPPPGLWKGRAVLAASDGDSAVETQTFEEVQTGVATTYFTTLPYTTPSPPFFFAQPPWNGTNTSQFKIDLTAAINNGSAIVSYVGHGAFEIIGNSSVLFSNANAAGLTNAPYLPLFVAFDCLAGGFHAFSTAGSLGEAMVNNTMGGSVASLAPAGLSSALTGDLLSDELFRHLLGKEKARILGVVQSEVHAALWTQGRIIDAQGLTFLGDPATRFVMPAPPAPTGLTAVAGNSQVTLSWAAPAQPVAGYRVYRASSSPLGTYSLACSPGASTSCVDTGVINATRYYYYAVSIDPDLFEGPASNLNGDCDAGPGCVTARPVNPNPPAVPTLQAVVDTGTGASLQVTWQPSQENDIQKYTLRYGSQLGFYPLTIVTAPNATSAVLTGLSPSVRYYVILSATNTSGLESAPSAPMSGVPHLVQGIAPPMAISDLRLAPSAPLGPDLVLTWTRPTIDIYGRPTTVTGYKVYRGTTPGFMVVGATPLATIGSGATTTYTDPQALINPAAYYYVVTASDAQGFASGGGRELPNGVSDLQVSMPSANLLHLAWTPPTTDFQGFGTLIDHYQIHVTPVPVRRESLNASTIVLDNVTVPSVDLSVTGSPRYISVLAVDNRGNLSPF